METGAAPWWTLPTLRIAFFRPLAVLTHWADYRLWPDSGVLMHVHSIAWYGAVLLLGLGGGGSGVKAPLAGEGPSRASAGAPPG